MVPATGNQGLILRLALGKLFLPHGVNPVDNAWNKSAKPRQCWRSGQCHLNRQDVRDAPHALQNHRQPGPATDQTATLRHPLLAVGQPQPAPS